MPPIGNGKIHACFSSLTLWMFVGLNVLRLPCCRFGMDFVKTMAER